MAKEVKQAEILVDDTKETVHTFLDKIAVAKMNGIEWVETSKEIIHHYNRSGLNGSKYFLFDGIKVCEKGELENILSDENTQSQFKVHGSEEGMVLGR